MNIVSRILDNGFSDSSPYIHLRSSFSLVSFLFATSNLNEPTTAMLPTSRPPYVARMRIASRSDWANIILKQRNTSPKKNLAAL